MGKKILTLAVATLTLPAANWLMPPVTQEKPLPAAIASPYHHQAPAAALRAYAARNPHVQWVGAGEAPAAGAAPYLLRVREHRPPRRKGGGTVIVAGGRFVIEVVARSASEAIGRWIAENYHDEGIAMVDSMHRFFTELLGAEASLPTANDPGEKLAALADAAAFGLRVDAPGTAYFGNPVELKASLQRPGYLSIFHRGASGALMTLAYNNPKAAGDVYAIPNRLDGLELRFEAPGGDERFLVLATETPLDLFAPRDIRGDHSRDVKRLNLTWDGLQRRLENALSRGAGGRWQRDDLLIALFPR